MGASPLRRSPCLLLCHLLGVGTDTFSYTEGADDVEVVQGMGKMEHVYCKSCHGMVEQHPKGAGFVALLPATFRCETPDSSNPCGVSCKLPAELVPNIHINYENRHYDWNDDLPKFVGFPGSAKLKNDGTPA